MKKKADASIMVAIESVDRSSLPLLKKAAALARQRNASLHLLHVIALPYGPVARAGTGVRNAFKQAIRDGEAGLRKLARIPQLRRVKVETTVTWDYPASDAIVRQVMKRRPGLLIAESRRHARLARVVLTNTDWDLIRNCPCPLLLSKTPRAPKRPTVVAALDPFHAHAKPAGLDAEILEAAVLSAGSGDRVHLFHAQAIPRTIPADGTYEPYWAMFSAEELAAIDKEAREALERQAQRFDVPSRNVGYAHGDPALELPRFAKRKQADIVVMGALSRSGLKRLFIGNTAEKVLDRLDCDVLIVKPRRFAAPISRRPAPLTPYPPYPMTMM